MNYQWQYPSKSNTKVAESLSNELNVPQIIGDLLVERGIESFDEAKAFFRPQLTDLIDPFLMDGMQQAVDRLTTAIHEGQKIMIYGDYDVDGSTSVALMVSFLRKFTEHVIFYQPDRYDEGYGISFKGIEHAKAENISLLIALDCGTKAIDKIELANTYQIDVIICDHHKPGKELPAALALLNPKKDSCNYPYKELCGCGIGFKLIQAFTSEQGWPTEDIVEYLDLVTIAIGADIVPLDGENRTLAYFGLKHINSNPRLGIRKLLETNNKRNNISISDLVFTIAPRVNAAGRISHANAAVEMLLVEDDEEATKWCDEINKYNTERRLLDSDITEDALSILKSNETLRNKKSTVLWDTGWHKGVVGIVASRLIENYYRPTIVLALGEDEATGSARSVKGFDVHEAIDQCSELLTKFGGHKYAAGLSIKKENLEAFREKFDKIVTASITADQLIQKLFISAEISSSDLVPETVGNPFPKLYRIIEQFAPFGPKNMRPSLLIKGLIDNGHSKVVGETHLKLNLKCHDTNQIFNGIAFGMGDQLELVQSKKPLDIVFTLDMNEFRGNRELQFGVKDLKLSEG